MNKQLIFKSACWKCQRAKEDPQESYSCPQYLQHWAEWEQQQDKYFY